VTLKFKDGYFAGDVVANNISSTSYNSDIIPDTDDAYDLGSVSAEWKDLYLDGTANVDALVIGTATAVTDVDTDLTSVSASDDTLASAKAIKTYVDAQVTAQDLDVAADTGTAAVDLDSQSLTVAGGTGIDSSATGQTVTLAIDSTVATLTGSQTLTNKTIDAASNTISNINTTMLASGVLDTDLTLVSASDDTIPSAKATKAYVDAQVTAQDLDVAADTGTAAVDLDSQSLTVAGGTGIDTSATGQTVTLAIDSTVATLTDVQTLTNKTLTSAVLDTGVSGTAILDEDNMASDSDTQLATQQSIKAYVDAQVAAGAGLADVVDDTTPQLGGTLDTNGQLIQFGDSSGATDDRLQLGDSQDMQLYHDGTNNKIDTAASQELHVNSDDVLFYDNSGTTRTAIVSPGSTMNFQLYDSTGTVRVFAVNGSGNEFHRSVYIQDQRSLGFKEDSANGTNYVAFQAPASVAANVTWTLPDADGTSGQFLQTDGSGALSWADEADGSALAFAIALG
jgi:hypothetical protein